MSVNQKPSHAHSRNSQRIDEFSWEKEQRPVLFALRLQNTGRVWYILREFEEDGLIYFEGVEPSGHHHHLAQPPFRLPLAFFEQAAEAVSDKLEWDTTFAGMQLIEVEDNRD
jgi:hypothetical protein